MATITLQTTPDSPNAVYISQFLMQSGINSGKLVVSAQIVLSAAKIVNVGLPNETWKPTGQVETIYLPDLNNLEPDLAKFQLALTTTYNKLTDMVESINLTRKVL